MRNSLQDLTETKYLLQKSVSLMKYLRMSIAVEATLGQPSVIYPAHTKHVPQSLPNLSFPLIQPPPRESTPSSHPWSPPPAPLKFPAPTSKKTINLFLFTERWSASHKPRESLDKKKKGRDSANQLTPSSRPGIQNRQSCPYLSMTKSSFPKTSMRYFQTVFRVS